MINTLNESDLHKNLKAMYAMEYKGRQEVQIGSYIADILCPQKHIFEIQTTSVSSLKSKIEYFLNEGYKVTVVYPAPKEKKIITKAEDGTQISKRKSPVKKSFCSAFNELTGLTDILLHKNFFIEILECSIIEIRTKTPQNVQSENKLRRHLRPWLKTGKELNCIFTRTVLHGKRSYKKLLRPDLPKTFTKKDFYISLSKKLEDIKENDASVMLWVLTKLQIVRRVGKSKNAFLYSAVYAEER